MVRASAMSHLQVQGQAAKKALPGIKAATKDENSHVRIMALGWMHLVGGEKPATVLPLFIEALRDDNATVRQTASVLLSNLGADAGPALKLLRELEANDPDPTVRNVAGNSARLIDGLIKK
jgi:HEAT repeat protein